MALRRYFGKISPLKITELVGHEGEFVIDESNDKIYIMDGVTPGGHEIANASANLNYEFTNVNPAITNAYTLGNPNFIWANAYIGNIIIGNTLTTFDNNFSRMKIKGSVNITGRLSVDTQLTSPQINSEAFINTSSPNFPNGYAFNNGVNGTTGLFHTLRGDVLTAVLFANGSEGYQVWGNGFNTVGGRLTQFYGNLFVSGVNTHLPNNLQLGDLGNFTPSNAKMTYVDNVNNYTQILMQNKNSGSNASGDIVVTADNGNDSSHYIDLGINSSTFSAGGGLDGPDDGYLLVEGGQLLIATINHPNDIIFAVGGDTPSNEVARIKIGEVNFTSSLIPTSNSFYNIGNIDYQWNGVYADSLYLTGQALTVSNGNLYLGATQISQAILNPFNQNLNTTDNVLFNSVNATTVNVAQINGTNSGGQLVIQSNGYNWSYKNDGNIQFPDGSKQSTAWTGHATTSGINPPASPVDGELWYSSTDGRLYTFYSNAWVDANPTVIPPPSTYIGNLTIDNNVIGAEIGTPVIIDTDLIPSANVTYSLGSATSQWKDLWVSNATIYMNSIPLSINANGDLTVNGNIVAGGGATRWDATPVVAGCPIYTELTPDHFQAYTQNSHLELLNDGYWSLGSNANGSGVFGFGADTALYSNSGNSFVRTGQALWTFEQNGTLNLPGPAYGTSSYSRLRTANSFLNLDVQYGSLGDVYGGARVGTNITTPFDIVTDFNNTHNTWRFGADGKLTIPAEISASQTPATGNIAVAGEPSFGYGGTLAVFGSGDFSVGALTDVQAGWTVTDNQGFTDTILSVNDPFGGAIKTTTINWPNTGGRTYRFTSANYAPATANNLILTANSHVWNFGANGNLTIPGAIKTTSNTGDVVINASNGTTRTWTFGGDGNLTLPVGGNISYTPNSASDWSGTPPVTLQEAIDRLATVVKVLNGGTGA